MGHLISSLTKEGDNASVNSTCTPPLPSPSQATAGHVSPGGGALQILHCLGAGHLPTPRPFPSFWHARGFLSEYNYTQKVLLEKTQIGSSVKDRNKLKRVVQACYWFYACVSSLLIKPELHSENWNYQCESKFFVIKSNFCWNYVKNILSYL